MLAALLLMYVMVIQASTYLVAWQGREMYPALSGTCILLGLGLGGVALGRGAVQPAIVPLWRRRMAIGLVVSLAVWLLALNVYSIIWLVYPALN